MGYTHDCCNHCKYSIISLHPAKTIALEMDFRELNNDQRRELINAQQRFRAWTEALARSDDLRGSMVWSRSKGREYLLRSYYVKGRRRQASLGPRRPETEQIKAEFDAKRKKCAENLKELRPVLQRQAAINRALGLGRVPMTGARIMRALSNAALLGTRIRVLGTYALFAYEAVAGVQIDSSLTATEDIDLLFDARRGLSVVGDVEPATLLSLLQRVDKSFERTKQSFRAANKSGYLVDLIQPLRDPPWARIGAHEAGAMRDDPQAAEIEGLKWLEIAPAFDAIAIDERGAPFEIVTVDPRAFAAHKLWISARADRTAIKRMRDRSQAHAIAQLVTSYFQHLPFKREDLLMLPAAVYEEAVHMFRA